MESGLLTLKTYKMALMSWSMRKGGVTSFLAKFDFFAFPIDLLLLKTEKKQNLKIQSNHRDMAVESCHGHNKKSDKSHRAPTSLPNNKRGDKTLGFTTIYFTLH